MARKKDEYHALTDEDAVKMVQRFLLEPEDFTTLRGPEEWREHLEANFGLSEAQLEGLERGRELAFGANVIEGARIGLAQTRTGPQVFIQSTITGRFISRVVAFMARIRG